MTAESNHIKYCHHKNSMDLDDVLYNVFKQLQTVCHEGLKHGFTYEKRELLGDADYHFSVIDYGEKGKGVICGYIDHPTFILLNKSEKNKVKMEFYRVFGNYSEEHFSKLSPNEINSYGIGDPIEIDYPARPSQQFFAEKFSPEERYTFEPRCSFTSNLIGLVRRALKDNKDLVEPSIMKSVSDLEMPSFNVDAINNNLMEFMLNDLACCYRHLVDLEIVPVAQKGWTPEEYQSEALAYRMDNGINSILMLTIYSDTIESVNQDGNVMVDGWNKYSINLEESDDIEITDENLDLYSQLMNNKYNVFKLDKNLNHSWVKAIENSYQELIKAITKSEAEIENLDKTLILAKKALKTIKKHPNYTHETPLISLENDISR